MHENMVDKIIAYEQGEMDEDDTVVFFQELVNTGLAWTLQGHYGRMAKQLIESGHVKLPCPRFVDRRKK
jgi:hypothetical protein